MHDVIIVGGGPAGLSAALTLRSRNKDVLLISAPYQYSGLYRAERIDNYPGLPGVTGPELLDRFYDQARAAGVKIVQKRVLSVMPTGDNFFVSFDNEVAGARALIVACGVTASAKFPGEADYLGRGVSYCATCDGMLYREKNVIVTGNAPDAGSEANYLAELGCHVTFAAPRPPAGLSPAIPFVAAKKLTVAGEARVTGLLADGTLLPADGIFILRRTIAPGDFLPGLDTEGGYVKTDRNLHTNLPGVFAAGDCTGTPLQVSVAAGEGQLAALEAVGWLDRSQ